MFNMLRAVIEKKKKDNMQEQIGNVSKGTLRKNKKGILEIKNTKRNG